ncbi:MAG: FAD:protein FMN transferase [Candidatus Limnocylindrales bacterium]
MIVPAERSALAVEGLTTPGEMFRHVFASMGTQVSLLLPSDRASEATAIEDLFGAWDAACTRFDPGSELSRLNAAGGRSRAVNHLLFEVLWTARQAAEATDGLFDPTLLRSLEAAGYDRDFTLLVDDPSTEAPEGPLPPTGGWRRLELDRERMTARMPAGVGLDLGGLAKGMAVDAAIAYLVTRGVNVAAVDAGGDLAVLGRPPGHDAWPIAVEAPDGTRTVSLAAGALATSSIARRRWRQAGAVRHHLIDPRTGAPSTVALWSVSVAAATCAQAEVGAKAVFLLGLEAGSRFLAAHGLTGLFLLPDGSDQHAGAWASS